jgi:hypothetical protein
MFDPSVNYPTCLLMKARKGISRCASALRVKQVTSFLPFLPFLPFFSSSFLTQQFLLLELIFTNLVEVSVYGGSKRLWWK